MSSPNLVIVDDDPNICRSLEFLFRRTSFSVVSYNKSESFLAELESLAMDCLLIDLQMPTFNGVELVERIRNVNTAVPIIIMTGDAQLPLAEEALEGGATGIIEKPFRTADLVSLIEDAIENALDSDK